MSGARPPHLQRRDGIYHLRVRVPDDLKLRVGLLEVRRSLRTHSPARARLLAPKYAARVMEVFEMVRMTDLSRGDARRLVRACFVDLAAEVDDGFVPETAEPQMELDWQRNAAEEFIGEVAEQVAGGAYRGRVVETARSLLEPQGLSLDRLSPARRLDILEGAARGLIEQQRLFISRLDDRLAAYSPQDPLFVAGGAPLAATAPTGREPSSEPLGPRLGEVVEKYLSSKRREWTAKTHRTRCRQLSYLTEHLGADTYIAVVTPPEIRSYRDAVLRLRSNHHVGAGKTFRAKQTDDEAQRIAPKTAIMILETTKAFFRWAKRDAYLAANPAEDIVIDVPRRRKGTKVRRPFSAEELQHLFRAPVFTGCRSAWRRFDPGSEVHKDAHYWLPILGYYTGARLGELVQLHLDDVRLDGPIPFLEITDANSGELGTGEEKHVKSEAGVRRAPLHPDVMALGFGGYVTRRRKEKRSSKRLFWQIGYGADGQPSTVFSKWFARLMDKRGLTDPALVFHSFRHGMEDALRDALQPQYVIDRIIGHTDGATSAGYGDGASLETLYTAMQATKLPVRLPNLLAHHPVVGEC